jgi:hypothetical protein
MDEPSAQSKVHAIDTYAHVIEEIENLEQFYESKVLDAGSIFDPKVYKVRFGSRPVPLDANGQKLHPRGSDGSRMNGKSESSDGSYRYYERPDTPMGNPPSPMADTPNSMAKDDMKSRWVPPNLVHRNDNYHSSVLNKGDYL